MQDKDLYEKILGLQAPWHVDNVTLSMPESKVTVILKHEDNVKFTCPECGVACSIHDHRKRQWRHLDTCDFATILEVEVPRVRCTEHGVHQIRIPWAEPSSGFTALFEAVAISWMKVASLSDVSKHLDISWDEAWGILERAVERGLARREEYPVQELAVDETSFQKRHEYVTVLVDRANSTVIDVLDDRKKATLKKWLKANKKRLMAVRTITMDMWEPFINAFLECVEDGENKICFDKFHVVAHFGKALDKVRASENKELRKSENKVLSKTRFEWQRSRRKGGYKHRNAFLKLSRKNLKTARAWRIKEAANGMWSYKYRAVALRNWSSLLSWISRCRLDAMKKVGDMIKRYLWGILNAIIHNVTNAISESINATIQRIKARACGYRNRERFRTAILFHKGGLSLMPSGVLEG